MYSDMFKTVQTADIASFSYNEHNMSAQTNFAWPSKTKNYTPALPPPSQTEHESNTHAMATILK